MQAIKGSKLIFETNGVSAGTSRYKQPLVFSTAVSKNSSRKRSHMWGRFLGLL